jgi:hypothetical protein
LVAFVDVVAYQDRIGFRVGSIFHANSHGVSIGRTGYIRVRDRRGDGGGKDRLCVCHWKTLPHANDHSASSQLTRIGFVWSGLVWFGLVWFGLVWFGLVWFGLVWFGFVSFEHRVGRFEKRCGS